LGGKAFGLHRLKELDLPVPPWITITADAFALMAQTVELSGPPCEIRANFLSAPLPSPLQDALDEVWRACGASSPLAVRSSAVDEDAADRSFAGQNDTFLNVRTPAELEQAVRGCWASLFGDRAVAYRRGGGAQDQPSAMAVVVQVLVIPDASGVLFTADPVSGRRDCTVVTAVWGLGEGLVSGKLDADTFELGDRGEVLSLRLAQKTQRIVRDPAGGVRTEPVAPEKVSTPSLTEEHLAELHRWGKTVEAAWGSPMDLEFCLRGEDLLLLQARPITTRLQPEAPAAGHHRVWDNANIVESYSGITLPLTFSFIRMAYRGVYVQFAELLGLSPQEIRSHEGMFWNMLGLIDGRVYYNLLNWYRLVALMPAFQANRRFMEQMMGLKAPVEELEKVQSSWGSGFGKLLNTVFRMAWLHLTLERRIARFHGEFREAHREFSSKKYEAMAAWEILEAFDTMRARVLWRWKAPIVNDFSAMIFYGLLKRLTVSWEVDPSGSLQNDLLCGEGGITSTEVMTELRKIADSIAVDGSKKAKFLAATPQEALSLLREDPSFADHAIALEQYLETYGVRCVQEMKLESVPMRENPTFCMTLIQNYLQRPGTARESAGKAEALRAAAEDTLRRRLAWKFTRSLIPKLAFYRWVLKNARRAVRNRENQRFARTQAYAVVRSMFRAIGKRWAAESLINIPADIFYLQLDEIESFVEGTSTCTDLKGLVALRRREYEGHASRCPEDHIETFGAVYGRRGETDTAPAEARSTLEGLGACQGVVVARARVVFLPDSGLRLNGEILVARETDPGWTVLFPSISGLVVEKGSMLSHSAIVAREMGIPAVVGVKGATSLIRDGQLLRLDGAAGKVFLLETDQGAAS
jgi:pyruvate,water dikinase